MAGTVLAVQNINDNGVTPAFQAAAAQMEVPNLGNMILHVHGGAGAANVSLKNQTTQDGNAGPDKVINVPAGQDRIIGPVPKGLFNLANGNAQIAIDTPANCTITAYVWQ